MGDSELIVSVVEAFLAELTAKVDTKGNDTIDDVDVAKESTNIAEFALEILEALSKTSRFDLSMRALSAEERCGCNNLFELIGKSKCCEQRLAVLRLAYEPPSTLQMSSVEDEPSMEDSTMPKPTFSLD